jgi:hypothetical protein
LEEKMSWLVGTAKPREEGSDAEEGLSFGNKEKIT